MMYQTQYAILDIAASIMAENRKDLYWFLSITLRNKLSHLSVKTKDLNLARVHLFNKTYSYVLLRRWKSESMKNKERKLR